MPFPAITNNFRCNNLLARHQYKVASHSKPYDRLSAVEHFDVNQDIAIIINRGSGLKIYFVFYACSMLIQMNMAQIYICVKAASIESLLPLVSSSSPLLLMLPLLPLRTNTFTDARSLVDF